MARINRRPSANRRSTLIDPEKAASGSMAEKFRSSILGAPGEFRDSTFDPDMASLDELRGRSGEIAKAMAPAPEELTFSDTGNIRDVFRLPTDIFDPGMPPTDDKPGWGLPPFGDPDIPPWADDSIDPNKTYGFGPGSGGMFPGSGGPGSSGMGGTPPTSIHDPGMMGKALTTGRILREHPDKFKDIGEAGGRFFKRTPAIQRRIDPGTAFSDMPPGPAYGTPGGYKFLDEADYWGKSESDPYFMGI
jgi:hypothetical protein